MLLFHFKSYNSAMIFRIAGQRYEEYPWSKTSILYFGADLNFLLILLTYWLETGTKRTLTSP